MSNDSHDGPQVAPELRVQDQRPDWRKGNRSAVSHGVYSRKRQLSGLGIDDIDRRTTTGRRIWKRHEELVSHCGGAENVSAVKKATITTTVFTELQVEEADFFLAQNSIINKRRRATIPLVIERNRMVETLLKLYDRIGYTPVERPTETLASILAAHAERTEERRSEEGRTESPSGDVHTQQEPRSGQDDPSEEGEETTKMIKEGGNHA